MRRVRGPLLDSCRSQRLRRVHQSELPPPCHSHLETVVGRRGLPLRLLRLGSMEPCSIVIDFGVRTAISSHRRTVPETTPSAFPASTLDIRNFLSAEAPDKLRSPSPMRPFSRAEEKKKRFQPILDGSRRSLAFPTDTVYFTGAQRSCDSQTANQWNASVNFSIRQKTRTDFL